jgi:hypothetical protein
MSSRVRAPSVRTALVIDAAFEFAVGAALVMLAPTLGDWFAFGEQVSIAIGGVFMLAGVAILMLVRKHPVDEPTVRALALANITGGAIGWVAVIAAWSLLEPGGRWLLAMGSDVAIIVGLLELAALRRIALMRETA